MSAYSDQSEPYEVNNGPWVKRGRHVVWNCPHCPATLEFKDTGPGSYYPVHQHRLEHLYEQHHGARGPVFASSGPVTQEDVACALDDVTRILQDDQERAWGQWHPFN